MEREAIVALKSLDADTCSRVSPDHLPGTIKLTDETLSRLAHLLKSGCSIQLACDEVRTRALTLTLCPSSPVLFVHRNVAVRLAFLERLFTAGSTVRAQKMHRAYTMSACKYRVQPNTSL